MQQPKAKTAISSLVQAEKMMQIALILPCAAVIGWVIGAWLDHQFHQKWISLVGIVFGGVSGLVYVIRLAMDAAANATDENQNGNRPRDGSGKGSPDTE
jgi:ATP synthase protein I